MKKIILKLRLNTIERLQRRYEDAVNRDERRLAARIQAVMLNNKGLSCIKIAHDLNRSRSCISEWLKNYRKFGYESLLEGYRCGCHSKMSESKKEQLKTMLQDSPRNYGFSARYWKPRLVMNVLQTKFGLEYHISHVRRIIKKLKLSRHRLKLLKNRRRRHEHTNNRNRKA